MATIETSRSHSLNPEEAKKRAEKLVQGMEAKFGFKWAWDGDVIKFNAPSGAAKGVTGTIVVGGNKVQVLVDLPLLLRPLKGTIESQITQALNENFA